MAQDLPVVFAKLNKPVTKTNVAALCAMACKAPEIFLAPASGPLLAFMAMDISCMYRQTRGLDWWSAYNKIIRKTIHSYGIEAYTDEATLTSIFDALDEVIAKIRQTLKDGGFDDFD